MKFRSQLVKTLFVCILLTISIHLSALHLIILNNGDKIKGDIIYQDKKTVHIKCQSVILKIPKSKIKNITVIRTVKPQKVTIFLKNKKRIFGTMIKKDAKRITLETDAGKTIILLSNIITIKKGNHLIKIPIPKRKVIKDIWWDSMWRSAIIPSWGQFYQGKKAKGWIALGITAISVTGSIWSYFSYKSAKDRFDSNDKFKQSDYDKMVAADRRNDIFLTVTVAAWILNIVDATIFAPSYLTSKVPGLSLQTTPDMSGIQLRVSFRF